MLNLCTENIVLIRHVIWPNKTYGEYISIKQNTKETSYILKNKHQYYNWAYIKMDPVKTEVNTENTKTEQKVRTDQDYRGEKTYRRLSIEFLPQKTHIKEDLQKEIDKKRHTSTQETGYVIQLCHY